ncbi:LysR substrate-binding domain-containing protein [Vibrio sp.]|uniref:LysR substrate-binding domain-containing protein n=1 Tax=Vibrio sp. TaxID=678 RepID=UPI003D0A7B29
MPSHLPSTKNLQAFIATAKHLNFSKAAAELNLTQGAISRQIQNLEQIIGAPLFYRHARGLSLTPQGNQFLPQAEEIIQQLRIAILSVSHQPNVIRLNAPSCATAWLLPKLMAFQDENPETEVELTSTIKHQVTPNFELFDAAIVYGERPKHPSALVHCLFDELLTPVCSPEMGQQMLADKKSPDISTLSRYPWLHADSQQSDWKLWLNHQGINGVSSQRNQNFSTLDQAMNAAQKGFGIAIGDIMLAEPDLTMGRLQTLSDVVVPSGKSYYFLYPKQAHPPLLPDLLASLIDNDD